MNSYSNFGLAKDYAFDIWLYYKVFERNPQHFTTLQTKEKHSVFGVAKVEVASSSLVARSMHW